ncbi:MAG: hypothetical protein V1875_01825 [Candidatus Altiarchaeota archaeon]
MGFCRRGQSSVEYIVNYGWAILVILVVGAVLWQLGILNNQNTSMSFTGFGKLKPQLAGTGLSAANGVFEGLFINGVGSKIFIKGVTITDANTGELLCCSHATYTPECAAAGGSNVNINGGVSPDPSGYFPRISPGDAFSVHIEDCSIGGSQGADPYNIDVELSYDALSGNQKVPHGDAGSIRGSFE